MKRQFPRWSDSNGNTIDPDDLVEHGLVLCFYLSNQPVPVGCCVCGPIFCDPIGAGRRYIEGGDVEHVQVSLRLVDEEGPDEIKYATFSVAMGQGAKVQEDETKTFSRWSQAMYAGFDVTAEQIFCMLQRARFMCGLPFSWTRFFGIYFCPSFFAKTEGQICISLTMEILHAGGMYTDYSTYGTTLPTLYYIVRWELTNFPRFENGHPEDSAYKIRSPLVRRYTQQFADQAKTILEKPKRGKSLLRRPSLHRKKTKGKSSSSSDYNPSRAVSVTDSSGPSRKRAAPSPNTSTTRLSLIREPKR
jgi:hypothetical protein